MPITHILLSALLSIQDTTLVDLTGDEIKEKIIFHRSYTDSSFCQIFTPKDSSYVKLLELKFKLEQGEDYRLFIDDYNDDKVKDFTIELPSTGITSYFTYDIKKKTFIIKE